MNNEQFSLKRRIKNQRRAAEFGPQNEVLFAVPDEAPGCYFKRFSSDGRFAFAFGGESRFLVYPVTYKGTLETLETENNENARFADFFRSEPIEIDVVSGLRQVPGCPEISTTLLCRDFCLTLKDKCSSNIDEFVVLAGSSPADCYEIEDKPPKSWQIRSDNRIEEIENDSHTAFPCLDHVTFFLVNLKTMRVVDFIHFKYEFIYLAHHLGVGLHDNLFSILSMKNQRIFVFSIENNQFVERNTIARNSRISPEDSTVNIKLPEGAQRDDSWGRPGVGGIVLKLIKHLAEKNGIDQVPLPASILSTLHIWKHQLLTEEKILLRLVNANLILGTNPRHQSMVHALDPLPSIHKNSYLVVYDRTTEEIEFVGNSASRELLYWMRDNWRWFRGRSADLEGFENILCAFTRENEVLSNSVVRRFTNCLPQSPQQLTDSVYFDPQIFRWDPKLTAALSRTCPISCNYFLNTDSVVAGGIGGLCEGNYGGERVKFFSRAQSNLLSHSLRFVDEADVQGSSNDTNTSSMDRHKWINVLFHPTLPLVVVYQYGIFRSINLRIFYH